MAATETTAQATRYRYAGPGGVSLGLSVFNLGLACCAVEFVAASMLRDSLVAVGAQESPASADVEVMVVSGTVTDKLAPAVLRLYEALPPSARVMSFGSCANSGGPYWDSYSVTKGVDQIVPIDVYVPGCPPRPEALLEGLRLLRSQVGDDAGAR